MRSSIKSLLSSLLVVGVQLLAADSAKAEIRPIAECKKCTTNFYVSDPACTPTSKVCERTFTVSVTEGVPVPITAGTFDCVNCPTVDGQPCEPSSSMPALKCDVNISATIEVTASIDLTATSGIEAGPFKEALELKVGFSETHSVTVGVTGSYDTPFCRKAVLEGVFMQIKGSKAVATCAYTRRESFSCPGGHTFTQPWSCAGGSATMTFDRDPFGGSMSVKSLNSCGQ